MSDWRARLRPLPAVAARGITVHRAERAAARRRGLGRLAWLPADRALHLRPCRAVHTYTMRFALDLVWLDRAGGVVRVDRRVRPRSQRTCLRAHSVVEVRAGEADRLLESGYTRLR